MVKNIWISLRPKQWLKNLFVFAGLFFAEDIFNLGKILDTTQAFMLFCLVSSAGYLVNDVMDRDKDRLHPQKRFRPIAAGSVPAWLAYVIASVFVVLSTILAFHVQRAFGTILLAYLALTLSYSLLLKQVIILDVVLIASGFVLRVIGGTLAAREVVSSWLIICTIFLALFLALTKRRSEFRALGDHAAAVRNTLSIYSVEFLDQMINIATAACLISYALYTLDPGTVAKFETRNLAFTLPFVIYGLFRYLFLVLQRNAGESPEIALLSDRPIQICVLAYLITVATILYW